MRTSKILLPILLIGMLSQGLNAQKIFERKRPDIFPLNGRYKLSGFHFAPGVTYMLTRFSNSEEQVFSNNDTTYNATFEPSGGIGLYAEAGWFQVFKYSSIVRYADVSIAYKQLKGSESFNGALTGSEQDTLLAELNGSGAFDERFLTFNMNFNNVLQLGDKTFLQNSLGANVDYRFSSTNTYSPEFGLNQQEIPGTVRAQIHYKIGFGWKLSQSIIRVPSLETPILSVHQWDDGRSDVKYFSSRYRPIIFSLRFILLRPSNKGFDCVPVKQVKKPKRKEYKPDSYHP